MRYGRMVVMAGVFLASAVPAMANTCQAGPLMCSTKMPPGGYCECTAHGDTKGGTSVVKPTRRAPSNATAGGCNLAPHSPGCP